jgi:hypothetical protein
VHLLCRLVGQQRLPSRVAKAYGGRVEPRAALPRNRHRCLHLHAAWKASKLQLNRFLVRRSRIQALGVYTREFIDSG